MPKVIVTRRELKSGDLPRVCMKCGDRTRKPVAKKLVFWPMNVRVMVGLLGLIGYALSSGDIVTIRARLPVCDRHRGHWSRGYIVLYGGLGVALVLLFVGLALTGNKNSAAFPAVFVTALVIAVAGLGAGALMLAQAIRIESVHGPDVELNKVCEEFIDALDDYRDGADDDDEPADEEYDAPRAKRSRPRDEDDEPRAKRPRRRDDDDEEEDEPRPRKRRRDDDD